MHRAIMESKASTWIAVQRPSVIRLWVQNEVDSICTNYGGVTRVTTTQHVTLDPLADQPQGDSGILAARGSVRLGAGHPDV